MDFCASIAHWVAAVVRFTSRVCPSSWKRSKVFGGGVSGGVSRECGGLCGVRCCLILSNQVAILVTVLAMVWSRLPIHL